MTDTKHPRALRPVPSFSGISSPLASYSLRSRLLQITPGVSCRLAVHVDASPMDIMVTGAQKQVMRPGIILYPPGGMGVASFPEFVATSPVQDFAFAGLYPVFPSVRPSRG